MKRIQYYFLIVIALLLLSACTGKTEQTDTSDNSQNSNTALESQSEENIPYASSGPQQVENEISVDSETRKILIAYFSWSENAV